MSVLSFLKRNAMQPQGGLSATVAAAHAGPVAAIGSPDEYIDKVKRETSTQIASTSKGTPPSCSRAPSQLQKQSTTHVGGAGQVCLLLMTSRTWPCGQWLLLGSQKRSTQG